MLGQEGMGNCTLGLTRRLSQWSFTRAHVWQWQMAETPAEENVELHQPALPPIVMAHEHLDHALDLWQDRAIYRCASKRSQERFHKDTGTGDSSNPREYRFHEDTATRDSSKPLLEVNKLWKVHKLANIRQTFIESKSLSLAQVTRLCSASSSCSSAWKQKVSTTLLAIISKLGFL